jgi:hypothetical protein
VSNTIRVYNALRHSGIQEHDAEEITNALNEFREEERLRSIEDGLKDTHAEQKLHRWMLGVNIPLSVAVLAQVIFMH